MKKVILIFCLLFLLMSNSAFASEDEEHSWKREFVLNLKERGIPREFITILISTLPIFELRGAIPVAVKILEIDWKLTFILAFLGNLIPVVPILLFLEAVSKFLRRFSLFDRFFEWLFARTRKKSALVKKYEAMGLILFVAVPLPVTGAWTGSVAAFLFGIRFWNAFLAIAFGVFIAGCIVTTLTLLGVWGAIIAGVVLSGLGISAAWNLFKESRMTGQKS